MRSAGGVANPLPSYLRNATTPEMSFPSVLVNETGLLPNSPWNEAYPRVRPSPGRIIACRPRRSCHRRRHLPQHLAGRGQLDGCVFLARWLSGAAFTPTALTALLTRTEYVLPQPDACWVQTWCRTTRSSPDSPRATGKRSRRGSTSRRTGRRSRAARDRAAGSRRRPAVPRLPIGRHAERCVLPVRRSRREPQDHRPRRGDRPLALS